MDFTNYQNILTVANALGGAKQTMFNKSKFAEAEATWARLTPEQIFNINNELPYATRIADAYFTREFVLIMEFRCLYVMPIYDIIWVYGTVTTNRMNFIPYNKEHRVNILFRDGKTLCIGVRNTGGFSKKDLSGDCVNQVAQLVAPVRKGVIFGWNEQTATAVSQNFAGVVQMVDNSCMQ